MAIFIEDIHVQNVGPLQQHRMRLGRFNLIYGRNERGKTHLVEFLIRSLFRNARQWNLRPKSGTGIVRLSGVEDGRLTEFTPGKKEKLEDYLEQATGGLPADFAKLLVVKGAEVALAEAAGGIDRAVLKQLLSGQEILDRIENRISKTIQSTTFEHGMLTGHKRGEIEERAGLREDLDRLDRLFADIEKQYSGGERQSLLAEQKKLDADIERSLSARRHLAYQLDRDIQELKRQCQALGAEKIEPIREEVIRYRQKQTEYERKKAEQAQAAARSVDFEWLREAESVYQKYLDREVEKPRPYLLILAALAFVAAGVQMFLPLPPWGSVASLLAGMVFTAIYVSRYRRHVDRLLQSREVEHLKDSFAEKFATELTGLPDILAHKQKLEDDYNAARLLSKQLSDDLTELTALQVTIAEGINSLTGRTVDSNAWEAALSEIERHSNKLKAEIHQKELALTDLQVDRSDYVAKGLGETFSREQHERLLAQRAQIEQQLRDASQQLDSLKQRICDETRDDISIAWETLLSHLRDKQQAVLNAYKTKTAEIVGKLGVLHALRALKEDEDAKIVAALQAESFHGPLHEVTGRYTRLTLEEDGLIVSDDFDRFYLAELSTGAQEQVLLALRIGFSELLMNKEKLFLILDDAFQYSDWQRRHLLVDKVAALAQSGWQVIYFTMDDQIRDLFDAKAKLFGDDYRRFELTDGSG